MPVSIFSGCSDACGWIAAITCVVAWGSFGVPLKKSVQVEMHPFVMQSYKTTVCFATCWCVLLLGEEFRWSYWGIASGMFWVPGAACGIYGIRNAGLAISVGTWSSINVLTSFFFGIIIFEERVKHFLPTCVAFLCLVLGLIGMARYSAHQPDKEGFLGAHPPHSTTSSSVVLSRRSVLVDDNNKGAPPRRPSSRERAPRTKSPPTPGKPIRDASGGSSGGGMSDSSLEGPSNKPTLLVPMEIEPLVMVNGQIDDEAAIMEDVFKDPRNKDHIILFNGRIALARRQLGLLGAIINGAWGGLNLIPLHYAMEQDGISGAGYLISYGSGSFMVCICIWILFFLLQLYQKKGHVYEALDSLPKFHLSELGLPGLASGLLYSFGNFMSILAVTYLGQGTGYSICQMQLFVSGLWGVFYFKEIKGFEQISKWFTAATLAVIGIIWLAYEHEGGTVAGHRRLDLNCVVEPIRHWLFSSS